MARTRTVARSIGSRLLVFFLARLESAEIRGRARRGYTARETPGPCRSLELESAARPVASRAGRPCRTRGVFELERPAPRTRSNGSRARAGPPSSDRTAHIGRGESAPTPTTPDPSA